MTKYVYNVHKNCIETSNGEFVAYLNSVDGVNIANKWTGLSEENEQLKQQYHKVNNKLHSIEGVLEDLGSKKYIGCDERLQALKKISKVMCE